MTLPIYLDYNATTPVHPEVRAAMMPYFESMFGNPSSIHAFGAQARTAVEKARGQVAALVGCKNHEIIFTSGGSESNNMAIKGAALQYQSKGNHIITSSIEHPAVSEVCRYLESLGFLVTLLPVDETGLVSIDDFGRAITPGTILATIMHANNEVGTIQPIREMAVIARKHGVLFHTDAAQSAGKIPLYDLGADLLSLAGHKFYAPKGVGALYVREGIRLEKLIHGADHEQNLRAGTENVAMIVGLGKACDIALRDMEANNLHARKMRDILYQHFTETVPELVLNGHQEKRLPNTLSVSFPGIDANMILSEISSDVAASAGAACHAGGTEISATLTAMHVSFEIARGTIRFSTGRYTTEEEIFRAAEILSDTVHKLRTQNSELRTQNSTFSTQHAKLTQFTAGLGCACKLRPQALEEILKAFPDTLHPDILVGLNESDDAAVYKINENQAIVQTLDFFTPIVDDPYTFGAIAAANALSDIYAMGAKPLFALNIVGFPSNRLPMEVLKQILQGASDKATEAGIQVIGGHTVEDPEPKFGMAVTGIVHPDQIIRNKGARPGDVLILTKPIGTGILATAMKRGVSTEQFNSLTIYHMLQLNKKAAEVMQAFPVSACTDITGFGLLGHLREMLVASGVDAEIHSGEVPLLPGTEEMAAAGVIPGGTHNNFEYIAPYVIWSDQVPEFRKLILCDAQTSGGLLVSLPGNHAGEFVKRLEDQGVTAATIGRITRPGIGSMVVK